MNSSRNPGGSWLNKRVAVLSPTPTSPQNYGNRRSFFNFFNRIKGRGAQIAFLHYPAEFDWRKMLPLRDQRIISKQWDDYFLIPPTRPLHAASEGKHHTIDEWWDPAIGEFLDWYFRVALCDVFIVNYTWLSRALLHAPPGVLRILHTHDQFTGRREVLEANGIAPEFFYLTVDAERAALERADVVWAVKEEEERFFRSIAGRATYTFPHVEQRKFLFSTRRPPGQYLSFGFMGAKNSINTTNYLRFFRFLKDYLAVNHLPANFVAAGSVCERINPKEFPFLDVMGGIEDVRAFYEACDVVVVPMSFSTGLKIKVGEAVGFGKALIGYAHSFEGYLRSHRFHALESDREICEAIATIVDNRGLVSELEAASVRTQADAEERADRCLNQTLAQAPVVTEQVVVVLQSDLLRSGLVRDHIRDFVEFVNYQTRPAVVIVGDLAEGDIDSIKPLTEAAHCYVALEALSSLSNDGQDCIRALATPIAAGTMLSDSGKIVYALSTRDVRDTVFRDARAVIYRIGLDRWAASGESPAAALERLGRSAFCLRDVGAPMNAAISGVSLEVPLLQSTWRSAFLHRLAVNTRAKIAFVATEEDHLESVLRVLRRHVRTQVLDECIAYTPHNEKSGLRTIDVREVPNALAVLEHWHSENANPRAVIDLTFGDDRFTILPEVCRRISVPLITMAGNGALYGANVYADNLGNAANRLVNVLLFPEYADSAGRRLSQIDAFAGENGWASLWRLIEGLRS